MVKTHGFPVIFPLNQSIDKQFSRFFHIYIYTIDDYTIYTIYTIYILYIYTIGKTMDFAPLRGGAATVSLAVVREALDVLIRIPIEDGDWMA